MTISVELQRALHTLMKRYEHEIHEFRITVHPELFNRLRTEDEELLIDIERKYAGCLTFKSDPTLHVEKFLVANAHDQRRTESLTDGGFLRGSSLLLPLSLPRVAPLRATLARRLSRPLPRTGIRLP
jgi:hypothetical protein